jgi:hypothetical protein
MAQPLSAAQLAYLAGEYTKLGSTLEQYQEDHNADPDFDQAAAQQFISDIDDIADNLANEGVATKFDDTAAAYASLTKVTQDANATAASLAQEVEHFSRIAKIATAMLGLAASLGSGNPESVLKSIAACVQAIGGHA